MKRVGENEVVSDSRHTFIIRGPGVGDWNVLQYSIAEGFLSDEDRAMKAEPEGWWKENRVDELPIELGRLR